MLTHPQQELQNNITLEKHKGNRVGFTTGCYDLLHSTHVKFLNKCKLHCDYLVVAVSSDILVKSTKGPNRPVISEKSRKYLLSNLQSVDYVFINNTFKTSEYINHYAIDVFIKGGKSMHEINNVKKLGIKVVNIRGCGVLSTSKIIKTIKNCGSRQ